MKNLFPKKATVPVAMKGRPWEVNNGYQLIAPKIKNRQ
jgi:hypothetical protein